MDPKATVASRGADVELHLQQSVRFKSELAPMDLRMGRAEDAKGWVLGCFSQTTIGGMHVSYHCRNTLNHVDLGIYRVSRHFGFYPHLIGASSDLRAFPLATGQRQRSLGPCAGERTRHGVLSSWRMSCPRCNSHRYVDPRQW